LAEASTSGFGCRDCGTEIETDHDTLTNDVLGTVRRDYLSFWSRYQDEIRYLTGGKPRRFKVPD